MNAASSRSHAVLTLSLSITEGPVDDSGGSSGNVDGVTAAADVSTVRSKISLVDLAGSERAKSTGAAGQRLKVSRRPLASVHVEPMVGDRNQG